MQNAIIKKIAYFVLFILFAMWIERINFGLLGFGTSPEHPVFNFAFILMIAILFLLIPNPEVQFWVELGFLVVQIVISTLNINLMATNGELFFWDMIALFEEGRQAVEGTGELSFGFLVRYVFLLLFFVGLRFGLLYLLKKLNQTIILKKETKSQVILFSVAFAIVAFVTGIILNVSSLNRLKAEVEDGTDSEILLSEANLYETFYLPELALKTFGSYTYYLKGLTYYFGSESGSEAMLTMIDDYLASGESQINDFSGVSAGNNVIVMLLESFEFFAISEELTPNLYQLFYEDGLLLTHYYGKTKTDMAEGYSLIGSYPATGSLYTGYSNAVYPQSLPNMLRDNTDITLIKSYHNNEGTFFNRNEAHPRFGFDELIDVTQMNVTQTKFWVNSDYEMLLDMQEEMIPSDDTPFFTYITTFVMHGGYQKRAAFQEYYDYFDEIGFYPEDETFDKAMRTYIAAAMDLDKAIGILFDRLEETGHLDDTTIFFFGDHNAYYSNLSYIMSGIRKDFVTLVEQYHFPAVIYDTKMKALADSLGIDAIDKFTTAADVTPTILNLLGIEFNPLSYVGVDVFSPVESVLISKQGGIFNNLFYSNDGTETWSNVEETTEEQLAAFHDSVTITMQRTQFTQLIFQTNYYALDRNEDENNSGS